MKSSNNNKKLTPSMYSEQIQNFNWFEWQLTVSSNNGTYQIASKRAIKAKDLLSYGIKPDNQDVAKLANSISSQTLASLQTSRDL